MPYKQYKTVWIDSEALLPHIGNSCPLCETGFIEENSFTSKKGVYYKSVKCESCQTKWLLSANTGAEKKIELIKKNLTLEQEGQKQIMEAIRITNENVKTAISLLKELKEGIVVKQVPVKEPPEKDVLKDIPTVEDDIDVNEIPF